MTSDSLAARVDRAIDEFPFYAGGERFESQGAVFVRNRSIPDKYYANHVEQVTASTPEEIARLSERIEFEFEGFRHRYFYVDRDTPVEFEAWLLMEGYQRTDSLVMVLTEELRGAPKPYEIDPVDSDADWQALYELIVLADREFDRSTPRRPAKDDASEGRALRIAAMQSVSPPVRYWLAYGEDGPRAFCSSWTSSRRHSRPRRPLHPPRLSPSGPRDRPRPPLRGRQPRKGRRACRPRSRPCGHAQAHVRRNGIPSAIPVSRVPEDLRVSPLLWRILYCRHSREKPAPYPDTGREAGIA